MTQWKYLVLCNFSRQMRESFEDKRISITNLSIGVANPDTDSSSGGDDLVRDVAVGPDAVSHDGHGTNHLEPKPGFVNNQLLKCCQDIEAVNGCYYTSRRVDQAHNNAS